jgi:hypothetical protein
MHILFDFFKIIKTNPNLLPPSVFDIPRGYFFQKFAYIYQKIRKMKIRLESLDIFRGITICFMIIVNTPGDWSIAFDML